jgi:hypothetical protein
LNEISVLTFKNFEKA